jgi:hypothetical protein
MLILSLPILRVICYPYVHITTQTAVLFLGLHASVYTD